MALQQHRDAAEPVVFARPTRRFRNGGGTGNSPSLRRSKGHIHLAQLLLLVVATGVVSTMAAAFPTGLNGGGGSGPSHNLPPITKVVVTGASGRTGRLVFEALQNDPRFSQPKALVRSQSSAKKLRQAISDVGLDQIVICDVVTALTGGAPPPVALQGYEALILCTSAVPRVSKWSLLQAFLRAPINLLQRKKAIDFRSFKFKWNNNQYPELVDYQGALAQFELAKQLGIRHIVVVGSMGGCDTSNFLNKIGKTEGKNGKASTGNGDILIWKRQAERFLVEQSDFDYTIIHPGGLVDTPGGENDFVLDVNDALLANQKRSISRSDVASLCLAGLTVGRGQKIVLDCITRERESEESPPATAEQALTSFLQQGKQYDYSK
jgi:nucleoside-diphosphate-sugar epimerase